MCLSCIQKNEDYVISIVVDCWKGTRLRFNSKYFPKTLHTFRRDFDSNLVARVKANSESRSESSLCKSAKTTLGIYPFSYTSFLEQTS